MSLLTLVQSVTDRIGLARPTAVVGSSDTQVRGLLSLANQEGKDLAARFDWSVLMKEKTFPATATAAQSGAIPDDFDRFVNGSMWNRTRDNFLFGPMSPQDWQAIQATVAPNVTEAFRVRGSSLLITPTPTAGDTYAFEYLSTYWVGTAASSSATLTEFSADTDITYLREELIALGVIWRFQKARGLDYSEAMQTYEIAIKRAFDRDGGAGVVVMSGPCEMTRAPRARVPDGNWDL